MEENNFAYGEYVLHYWEGEVRQFLGQGWVVGRPVHTVITNLEAQLIRISS